jgi:hypothetical protein
MNNTVNKLELKMCRSCNEYKEDSCFRVASRQCRECISKKYTKKNKDYMKQYYEAKKDTIKENTKRIYNEVYKPLREQMYLEKGIEIKKRGGQQKYFKPENSILN